MKNQIALALAQVRPPTAYPPKLTDERFKPSPISPRPAFEFEINYEEISKDPYLSLPIHEQQAARQADEALKDFRFEVTPSTPLAPSTVPTKPFSPRNIPQGTSLWSSQVLPPNWRNLIMPNIPLPHGTIPSVEEQLRMVTGRSPGIKGLSQASSSSSTSDTTPRERISAEEAAKRARIPTTPYPGDFTLPGKSGWPTGTRVSWSWDGSHWFRIYTPLELELWPVLPPRKDDDIKINPVWPIAFTPLGTQGPRLFFKSQGGPISPRGMMPSSGMYGTDSNAQIIRGLSQAGQPPVHTLPSPMTNSEVCALESQTDADLIAFEKIATGLADTSVHVTDDQAMRISNIIVQMGVITEAVKHLHETCASGGVSVPGLEAKQLTALGDLHALMQEMTPSTKVSTVLLATGGVIAAGGLLMLAFGL